MTWNFNKHSIAESHYFYQNQKHLLATLKEMCHKKNFQLRLSHYNHRLMIISLYLNNIHLNLLITIFLNIFFLLFLALNTFLAYTLWIPILYFLIVLELFDFTFDINFKDSFSLLFKNQKRNNIPKKLISYSFPSVLFSQCIFGNFCADCLIQTKNQRRTRANSS